jgi:hypothetical protein
MRLLLVLACVAGGWAVICNSWFSAGANSVGLFGVQMCADYCQLESWQSLKAPYELLVLGGSTFLGVAHTAAFAIHAWRRPERAKVRWTIATAVATVAVGVAFLVRAPGRLPGLPLTISYAPFLALAATVALTVYVVRARATSSS